MYSSFHYLFISRLPSWTWARVSPRLRTCSSPTRPGRIWADYQDSAWLSGLSFNIKNNCIHFKQIFENLTKNSFLYSILNNSHVYPLLQCIWHIRFFIFKKSCLKNYQKCCTKRGKLCLWPQWIVTVTVSRSYGSSEMTIHGPPGCMDIYEANLILFTC